jgi:hypothetical protein
MSFDITVKSLNFVCFQEIKEPTNSYWFSLKCNIYVLHVYMVYYIYHEMLYHTYLLDHEIKVPYAHIFYIKCKNFTPLKCIILQYMYFEMQLNIIIYWYMILSNYCLWLNMEILDTANKMVEECNFHIIHGKTLRNTWIS